MGRFILSLTIVATLLFSTDLALAQMNRRGFGRRRASTMDTFQRNRDRKRSFDRFNTFGRRKLNSRAFSTTNSRFAIDKFPSRVRITHGNINSLRTPSHDLSLKNTLGVNAKRERFLFTSHRNITKRTGANNPLGLARSRPLRVSSSATANIHHNDLLRKNYDSFTAMNKYNALNNSNTTARQYLKNPLAQNIPAMNFRRDISASHLSSPGALSAQSLKSISNRNNLKNTFRSVSPMMY